ncbi:hypothetical protein [Thalassorhabdomicrobium marinisediminis]|uniref:Cation/multidrug efflux pump n=1 Tax=Thalassorhabdomicrobium marinisediminis TaxID=2170577 RepID=A0A2T7FZF2_9RHOB|nr:hypothetical protein [Thalassorhabdomicrobium marinisediminis]PVA07545.1 hypothetical protein DC363_02610 [Thalassorhabdomicrobium marinisediminis]
MFIRLMFFGFLGLIVLYAVVSVYSRSVRREKLEDWWEEEPVEGKTREAYIEEGMAAYDKGLRKKLILLIFVIPPLVAGAIIYLIN